MAVNLRGNNVSSAAPSAGQVLSWDGTQWAPAASGGGITELTDDVSAGPGSGSATSNVNAWTGNPWGTQNAVFAHATAYFTNKAGGPSLIPTLIAIGSPSNYFDSMVVLSAERNTGSGISDVWLGADTLAGNPYGGAPFRVHMNGTDWLLWGHGQVLLQSGASIYGKGMTRQESGRADVRIETFVADYTTDTVGNVTSLMLEAALPAGGTGATLHLHSNPQPGGPGNPSGRVLYVADVSGTLSVGNPLNIVDDDGRGFLVEGNPAPITPLVLTSSYASRTLRLTSDYTNWIVSQ